MALCVRKEQGAFNLGQFPVPSQTGTLATFLLLQHPMQVLTLNSARVPGCGEKPGIGQSRSLAGREL